MKASVKLTLLLLAALFVACKKETPYYRVSDDMQQYFVYPKGSSWVYRDDSTGFTDSSYIIKYTLARQGVRDQDGNHLYSFDLITMYFQSTFLSNFQLGHLCPGPDCLTVAGNYGVSGDTLQVITGPIAFCAGWEPNTTIHSQKCFADHIFTFRFIPEVTIENNTYSDIIYSRLISTDSSESNPYFYFREIYFAKNIGIVKYVECTDHFNVHRSMSLTKYSVIQ